AIMMQDKTSSVLRSITGNARQTKSVLRELSGPVKVSFDSTGAVTAIQGARTQNDRFRDSLDCTGDKADLLNSKFSKWAIGIGTALYALQKVGGAIAAVTDKVDEYTNMRARLNLINDGNQTTGELSDMVYAAAQRSRGNYADMGAIVGKMGILAGDAFGSNQELVGFTELMQKAFRVGGASTQEQQAGMYQLTQAMAAGKLQGDEFRSIMENAPMLAQAIADYTGKSKGELKEMSAEGTITADIIRGAMFAAGDDINEMFESMPMTFADVKNKFLNTVSKGLEPAKQKLSQMAGSEKFQRFFENLANVITVLGNAAVGALDLIATGANFVADHWDVIGPILLGVAIALGVLTAASLVQKAAQWALNASMYACPITWIVFGIAAIIAIIALAVSWMNRYRDTNISAMGVVVGIFAIAGAAIWNIFAMIANIAFGVADGIWNAFAAVANFLGNVFVDPVGAIANLFADLANSVLSMIKAIAKGVDTILGTHTADSIGKLQDKLTTWAASKTNGEYEKFVPTMERSLPTFDLGEVWNKSYQWGKGIPDKIKDAIGLDVGSGALGATDIGSVGNVDTVDKVNDSVDISDESLRYLSDAMVRSYVNKINVNTMQPNFSIEFTGDITQNADADRVAEEIIAKAKEKMYSGVDDAYGF
ncbi:MAG: tape measure protein, partial [Bacillota bacterium]|nr:tape measure protein [Bacillota bacterium]